MTGPPEVTLPVGSSKPQRNALRVLKAYGNPRRTATALLERAEAVLSTKPRLALGLAKAARSLGEETRDVGRVAYAIRLQGHANRILERHEEALADYAESRRRFLALGDAREAARTLIGRVDALMYLDRLEEARRVGRKALREFRGLGDEERAGRVLMNLGNVEYRRDRPVRALELYQEARAVLEGRTSKADLAFVDYNIANALVLLDAPDVAEKRYGSVLDAVQGSNQRLLVLHVHYALAGIDALRAHYPSALRRLEQCEREFAQLRHERGRCHCLLDRAEIYDRLALAPECRHSAEEAERGFRRLGLSMETERARFFTAIGAIGSGDVRWGVSLATKVARGFRALRNPSQAAVVELRVAQRNMRSGHRSRMVENERVLKIARRRFVREGFDRLATEAQLELARLALKTGNLARAERRLSMIAEKLHRKGWTDLVVRWEHLQMLFHERRANSERAFHHARTCLSQLDRLRDQLSVGELVAAHLFRMAPVYQDGLRVVANRLRSDPDRFFDVLERIQSVRESTVVGTRSDRGRLRDAATEELRERLAVLGAAEGRELPERPRRKRARTSEIRRVERALLERTRRTTLGGRIEGEATSLTSLEELQQSLGNGDLFVQFVDLGDRVGSFLVTRESAGVGEHAIPKPEVRQALRRFHYHVEVLRVDARRGGARRDELRRSADDALERLARVCLPALESRLEQCNRLLVRPSAGFEVIPWGALPWGQATVWDHAVVHVVPDASSLRAQWGRARSDAHIGRRATLWAAGELAATVDEVKRIREILGVGDVFQGDRANANSFLEHAPKASLIHFCGHGTFRQDNPLFSSLRLTDRELTFLDLEGLTIKASLVVLSACSSGGVRAELGFGSGISRGFLNAGAKALLVSLWRIGDIEALEFMEAFYTSLTRKRSAGEALREAALRGRREGHHPADWAAFQVIGLG